MSSCPWRTTWTPTKGVSPDEMVLRFTAIEHGCPKQGFEVKCLVVAVGKCICLGPIAQCLCARHRRAMGTCCLCSKMAGGMGGFRDHDIVLLMDQLHPLIVVCEGVTSESRLLATYTREVSLSYDISFVGCSPQKRCTSYHGRWPNSPYLGLEKSGANSGSGRQRMWKYAYR